MLNYELGAAFVQALRAAGAKEVYAAARDPPSVAAGDGVAKTDIPIQKLTLPLIADYGETK